MSTSIPQPSSLQQDYRQSFEPSTMFFQPLSVDTANFQLSNNLPVRPQPQNPTHQYLHRSDASKDLSQRQTSAELVIDGTRSYLHKKFYSLDNGNPRESGSNLASLKSISLSHGNLYAADYQNMSSGDTSATVKQEFIDVNKGIGSCTPKELNRSEQLSADTESSRFLNSFRRYSLPPDSFARSLSVGQLQPCGVSDAPGSPKSVVEAKPPAVPQRPPKPPRFCKDERRHSQQMQETVKLQETMKWVSRKIIILFY
jgi:hypothetical protein